MLADDLVVYVVILFELDGRVLDTEVLQAGLGGVEDSAAGVAHVLEGQAGGGQ